LAFSNFHRSRKQGKLFEEIFQNFVKTALCGVVGSERTFKRVWDSSQQAKSVRQAIGANGQIYGKGYPFPMLAPKLLTLTNTERKGKKNGLGTGNQGQRICTSKEKANRRNRLPQNRRHIL
jgi:hypothetical protein